MNRYTSLIVVAYPINASFNCIVWRDSTNKNHKKTNSAAVGTEKCFGFVRLICSLIFA